MTVDEWLQQYGNQRGYIMEDPSKTSDIRSFVVEPSRLFDALDLAMQTKTNCTNTFAATTKKAKDNPQNHTRWTTSGCCENFEPA